MEFAGTDRYGQKPIGRVLSEYRSTRGRIHQSEFEVEGGSFRDSTAGRSWALIHDQYD